MLMTLNIIRLWIFICAAVAVASVIGMSIS